MRHIQQTPRTKEYETMSTRELREAFLLEDLFQEGKCGLAYWETDRAIIGGAVPAHEALKLEAPEAVLAAEFFCERREVGVINLGGSGRITTDGEAWPLAKHETLYIGRGTREVGFRSDDPADPASFYIVSFPAHCDYPTTRSSAETTNVVKLGSPDNCNERTIHQQIHREGIRSCQLVMGYTEIAPGSIWNTFPPHTHLRRCEIYNYFDLADDNLVMHFMGPAEATRHLVVRNHQPVLSPPWSIHSGAGTGAYKFVWAMGGENQEFTDMDGISLPDLR